MLPNESLIPGDEVEFIGSHWEDASDEYRMQGWVGIVTRFEVRDGQRWVEVLWDHGGKSMHHIESIGWPQGVIPYRS